MWLKSRTGSWDETILDLPFWHSFIFLSHPVLVDHQQQQSIERVDYNGPRPYMTSYIQAKFSETEGLFAVYVDFLVAFKVQVNYESACDRVITVFYI